jgi:hypothetical protein
MLKVQLGFCLAKLNSRAGRSEAIIVGPKITLFALTLNKKKERKKVHQTSRSFEARVLFFKFCDVCAARLLPCKTE